MPPSAAQDSDKLSSNNNITGQKLAQKNSAGTQAAAKAAKKNALPKDGGTSAAVTKASPKTM
jgi:hypothetical protein